LDRDQTALMLKLTQILIFVNALVWLVFGLLSFTLAGTGAGPWRVILSGLMVANAVVLAWFGMKIASRRAWVFFLGILYMAFNVVLSITDQFGWIDALILLLNLCLLGLLFVTRQRLKRVEELP